MSIVKMKKIRVICIRDQRDALMKRLMHLGCVQVEQPAQGSELDEDERLSAEHTGLSRLRTRQLQLENALAILDQHAPQKKAFLSSRPEVKESDFLDTERLVEGLTLAREIVDWESEYRRLAAEESRVRTDMDALRPWETLDEPLSGIETRTCAGALVSAVIQIEPAAVQAAAEGVTEAVEIVPVSQDALQRSFVVLAAKEDLTPVLDALRVIGCTQVTFPGVTGTARENLARKEKELAAMGARRQELLELIKAQAPRTGDLQLTYDRVSSELFRLQSTEALSKTSNVVLLQGWCPADKQDLLTKELSAFDCAFDFSDPEPEEYPDVPVELKNGPLIRPMNMVTDMYALPAYDGVDPNPLMWPFFILFYGMMMADMGYGLVMILLSVLVMKKRKPRGETERYLFPLMGICGVTTFLFGAVTGSFFGDMPLQLARMIDPNTSFTGLPALFSPLNDALMVLIGSLALGVVQIFTGMGISVYNKVRRGDVPGALFEEIAWYAILIGAVLMILKITPLLLIAGAALVVFGAFYTAAKDGKKGFGLVLGGLKGIFGSLYNNVTGYFSDILSYSRLMALMLAGAVIAQVFNTLGGITGNVIAFFIISMIGNTLNFALNLLGCFVHDMRLQCLEYFGRFYEDGGKPFRPLDMKLQYVDILKE